MATSSISSNAQTHSPSLRTRVFGRAFKAFTYPDFRIMWIGACTSTIGSFMQTVAQAWLIYYFLTKRDAFYLGFDTFLAQMPIVLFSLIGGVIADRYERRRMLMMSQIVQMTCAFTLAALYITGRVKVEHVLLLSFITGCGQSFGGPAYQALIPSLVKKEDLQNAIALNSIQFNLARVIGPALGGIALAYLGAAWCFGLNGLSFVAVLISLSLIKTRYQPVKTGESVLESMKQGIRFLHKQPGMVSLIALAFLMTALAIPLLTFLPAMASSLGGEKDLFTVLLCCSGAGAICGALIVAYVGHSKHKGRSALLLLVLMGLLMSGFALSKIKVLSAILIFISGAAMMASMATISSLVQLITSDNMRGRVMSVYNVAFRGGMPIGSLIVGKLIPIFTAPAVLAVDGALLSLLGVYFLTFHRKIAAL